MNGGCNCHVVFHTSAHEKCIIKKITKNLLKRAQEIPPKNENKEMAMNQQGPR